MKKRSELMSLYLDGMLSPSERRDVEALLERSAEARTELDEVRRLKALLGDRKRLEPDPAFWTRLSARLQNRTSEEQSLLPFPRRFLPAVGGLAVLGVAAVGFLLIQNRISVMQFFSRQTQAVKEVYERGLLKGNILPVLASVDRDDALRFSLFGTLPLDEKSKTTLRVDETAERGYRIEVGKPEKKSERAVTFDAFMAEVKPTARQREVIDSLLEYARHRLASSVLAGDNNALAIDPDLPKLNRTVVAGIASCLEPPQRVQLVRLLTAHRAPYTVEIGNDIPAEPELVMQRLRPVQRAQRFVLIRPDTTGVAHVQVDLDRLHQQTVEDLQLMQQRRAEFFRRFAAEQFRMYASRQTRAAPAPIMGDSEFMRVEIGGDVDEDGMGVVHVTVIPRDQRGRMGSEGNETGPVKIRIFRGSTRQPGVRTAPEMDFETFDSLSRQLEHNLRNLDEAGRTPRERPAPKRQAPAREPKPDGH